MVSACNALENWFDRPLDTVPASPDFIRRLFTDFHHERVGVSKGRVGNVRSLMMAALRHVGLANGSGSYLCPLAPAWQTLWNKLPGKYPKTTLSRFFRFCSAQCISPANVGDDVADAFLKALIDETLTKDPRTVHQNVCRVWNQMRERAPGWPNVVLTVPVYRTDLYGACDDEIHPDLRREIRDYLEFLGQPNPFKGPPKSFRPASLKATESNIRRYLGAARRAGVDIGVLKSLDDMVARTVFKKAIQWLWERAGRKATRHTGEIAWTIRCIAIKQVGITGDAAQVYIDAVDWLRVRQKGLSDKNKASMAEFEDKEAVRRFLFAPDLMWARAEKTKGDEALRWYEAAVAVAILMTAPMRLANLASLHIEKHMSWRGGHCYITIPADEVKNGETLEYKLPGPVTARLRHWLFEVRTGTTIASSPYVFPARRREGPRDHSGLAQLITNRLFEITGLRLTPHQFRHLAAHLLLSEHPGHYEVVRRVLGHKSLTTTLRHYAGHEAKAAFELYDRTLTDLKHETLPESHEPELPKSRRRRRPSTLPFDNDPLAKFQESGDPRRKARLRSGEAFLDPLKPFGKQC
jgi:integrase